MNANAPALHIDGIIISVAPHPEHEYTLTTAEVAAGYGVSEITIRRHKKEHADELAEGKHFISVQNLNSNPRAGIPHVSTIWTKRGIIRLGFFIKSERAKRFRDMAEDLVLRDWISPESTLHTALTAMAEGIRAITDGVQAINTDLARVKDRLARLEQTHQPRYLPRGKNRPRLQSLAHPSDEEVASDMLRLVAHLFESSRHDYTAFTARDIITRAARLRCFRHILRGRYLADGSFDATPAARSYIGKLLSQRFSRVGFILDNGAPTFLRHSGRGRAKRYYLVPAN